jgi:hypothetical protein
MEFKMNNELEILKIAYRNCLNDLGRTKAHLKIAEDILKNLSSVLNSSSEQIRIIREDNPGTGGSGG